MALRKIQREFRNWLQKTLLRKRMPRGLKAINIGLCEIESGYSAYVALCGSYDSKDADWACDEIANVRDRYFSILYDGKVTYSDWLSFVKEEATAVIGENYCKMSKWKDSLLAITTGFDDGQLKVLWKKPKQEAIAQ
jgi:hypothetical protein